MEKNIREKLNNLRFWHGFLDMTSIAYEIKVKIDMWDDIRLKNVFIKDLNMNNSVERQPVGWGKCLQMSNKRIIFGIHKNYYNEANNLI